MKSVRPLPLILVLVSLTSLPATSSDVTLAPAVTYGSGGYIAKSVAVADVNGDGKPDIVVANFSSSSTNCAAVGVVSVLLGNGNGTFQTAVPYGSGGYSATSVAVADVNGDGKPDIVVANAFDSVADCSNQAGSGTIGVLIGNGDGTFKTAVPYASGGNDATSVAVVDVNGDGKPDLIALNFCTDNTFNDCANINVFGAVGVLIGNGDGTFQGAVSYQTGGYYSNAISVADVNGDGKPDLLVASECNYHCSGNGWIGVLLGNGNGTFQTAVTYYPGEFTTLGIAVADLNHDQKADIVVVGGGGVSVLLGNGNGTFNAPVAYGSGTSAVSVMVSDLNGDGNPDLVTTGSTGGDTGTVGVLQGNGDGTFQSAISFGTAGDNANFSAVADVNGDGRPDVVVAECNAVCTGGAASVLVNTSQTFTTLFSFSDAVGGGPNSPMVQGIDGNLYGTAAVGGLRGDGIIFRMTPAGALSTVHYFSGPDGMAPQGLMLSVNGNLFGTTISGGSSTNCPQGCGTVFEITSAGTLVTLHSFSVTPDGNYPESAPVQARDGSIYGTTTEGGTGCCGTIYKIDLSGNFSTVYNFTGADGNVPQGSLVVGLDGNLYGTTSLGGLNGYGTVFQFTPAGHLTTIHNFDKTDGWSPLAALVQAPNGHLYGTTALGGPYNYGTVFWISPSGAQFWRLRSFDGNNGGNPADPLVLGADGNLYGGTSLGNTSTNYGTLFEITPGGVLTTLHTFNGTDGGRTVMLMQATSGSFYGTNGGFGSNNCPPASGCGTAFTISTGLGPFINTVPTYGWAERTVRILGYGLTGTTNVSFNGTAATFTVASDTEIITRVPSGATNGKVSVTTPSGTLSTKTIFQVP